MTNGVTNPQITDKIDELFSAILKDQQQFEAVKGPDKDKAHLVKQVQDEYQATRGRGFVYPYVSSGRGHGPFTELVDGSVKYDLINGIGINLLGHSHPIYIKSALEAATVDTIMCGNLMPYQDAAELSKTITKAVKKNNCRLQNFWFAGSGSFANDLAIKMLWQKQQPKYEMIGFAKAFAGRSIATHDVTANPAYKEGMPELLTVHRAPHFDHKNPETSLENTLKVLNEIYEERGDKIGFITLELIQGEAGFVYGPREFYVGIFEWAKEKGLYIWVDEVQTFGRTRELFAFQMLDLDEYVDVVTLAKAFQGAGVLYTDEVSPKPGLIAGTFNGSIHGMKAAKKTLDYLLEGNFYGDNGKVKSIEDKFLTKLNELMKGSCKDKIHYAGGLGTMISFEVGDTSKEFTMSFLNKLFDNGIIAFLAGKEPTRVRFLLPVCLTDEHIDEIFQIIEKTVLEMC